MSNRIDTSGIGPDDANGRTISRAKEMPERMPIEYYWNLRGKSPNDPQPVSHLHPSVARGLVKALWVSGIVENVRPKTRDVVRFALRGTTSVVECTATGAAGRRIWALLSTKVQPDRRFASVVPGDPVLVYVSPELDSSGTTLQLTALELHRDMAEFNAAARMRFAMEQTVAATARRTRRKRV